MTRPLLDKKITFDIPVPTKDADGREAMRDSVTMRRPRTTHVKRLAVLLGPQIAKAMFDDQTAVSDSSEGRKFFLELLVRLLTHEALNELTGIVADMCGEKPEFIDEIDPLDLVKLGEALFDFFPALRSLASSNLAPTLQPSTAGTPET